MDIFHSEANFEIVLRREGVTVVVRMPSQAEWAARGRLIKSILHRLGPGQTETRTEGVEAADLGLLASIRVDNGEPLDDACASAIIERLTRADVEDEPVREGPGFLIPITAFGGIVTHHLLRIPTLKETRAYRKAAYSFVDLRRGRQQVKVSVDAICDFYDGLLQRVDGYEGAVPPMHKMAAVTELMAILDELESEEDPKQ